ncbi:MAG: T9SS type A sorting domain-containing protein [Ignavibacteriales bacterium]|nr:MAG: T9SS type A sorting domain-containing protein [Ignavibacteriales bacterium]
MRKSSGMMAVMLLALLMITVSYFNSYSQPINKSTEQGGILKFTEETVQSESGSSGNISKILLTSYSGRPLKAMQFNIIVGKDGGSLLLKSVSRGTGIPSSSFLFDYEIYRGTSLEDGSSIDTIRVVILGNGTNVIEPGNLVEIISISYDIVNTNNQHFLTKLSLTGVLGATSSPVENANIEAGEDQVIYLTGSTLKPEEGSTLRQNYPNPFNPATTINFTLNNPGKVTLKIFNSVGEEIATLIDGIKESGEYTITYSAESLPSGVYLYQLITDNFIQTRKMILMR